MQPFIEYLFLQFVVGMGGMSSGETVYILNYTNILTGSVEVKLDGSELPINKNDQISYSIVYTPSNATITFVEPVSDGQLYIIQAARFTS